MMSEAPTGIVCRLLLAAALTLPLTGLLTGNAFAAPGENDGILESSIGTFHFAPSSCAVYREDGVDDIEIEGRGTAPNGEKMFLELSSTGNALTINLGVDESFQSSDRAIRAGAHISKPFTVEIGEGVIEVHDLALIDENQQPIAGPANLTIRCGG